MSTDYNSRLIAELYAEKDPILATEIADLMVAIKDAIFLHPIYAAYRRFPADEFVSHFFSSDLTEFKTPEAAEIIKEIARDPVHPDDLSSIINYLIDIKFFDEDIVMTAAVLAKQKLSAEYSTYELGMYLKYVQKADQLKHLETELLNTFLDEGKRGSNRKTALYYLLRSNPNEWMQFLLDNMTTLISRKSEIILAEELVGWKGAVVDKIKAKLLESGSSRTKEILKVEVDQNKATSIKKDAIQQEEIAKKYSNADIVADISSIREKINSTTATDPRFASALFTISEKLPQQNTAATDKQSLAGYALELRSIMQGIDKNITSKEYSEDEYKSIIPDIDTLNGSINKLHVFLVQAKVDVDLDIFGLRTVNKIVSKLAHPDDEAKTLELLKRHKFAEYYEKEEWGKLHRQLLEAYRDSLAKLLTVLK